MNEDPRCCGTGTCIIDNEGRCWCGQQWDGEKMCHVAQVRAEVPLAVPDQAAAAEPPAQERNAGSYK
jgi:hypothetical protein